MSKQLTEKNQAAKSRALASRDLEDIEALRKFPPFTRMFGRRITEELEKLRNDLLYNRELTPETLWEKRLKFLAHYDVAMLLFQDETACRSVIGAETEEG